MIFFSCAKRSLPSYGSIEFSRNEQYMSADSFSSSGTRMRPASSFPIISPQIISTEPLCWSRIPMYITVETQFFSQAIEIIWRRLRLVSEENSLHVRHHAFSRSFYAQIFVPCWQRRYFNHTFDRSHYPNGMIACGLCFIWHSNFVKNYSTYCSRYILSAFLTIDSYHAKIWRIFLKILTLSPISVLTQRFILLAIDLFILTLAIFYNKDFFACKVFSTSYIAGGITKLIAWTTSFLEECLDFEITWSIWKANNATMFPPWPKNIHLYLKILLLIQNAWRTNLT